MSTSTSPEMVSSSLDSIPGSPSSTQPSQPTLPSALPSLPSLLPPSTDADPSASPQKTLGRPQDYIFFFDPTSEKAAKLSADLITLIPDEPSFITPTLEEATHVLLAQPSTYADQLVQARARSPPPPSSPSSSSRPQQLLALEWVRESIRLKEWQPEERYIYVSMPEEGKGRVGRVSRRSAGGSSVPESSLPKGTVLKPKEKKETTKASKKKAVSAAYSVQESTDLRRFLRESQTIADACEKMAAAHPRRTAGTVRVYYSKNKDEFEDELGSEAPVHSWVWTPDEHVLLVKVLAGPVGSLNRGFKAFSEQHPKRSVIAAAKYYQNNRIRLELEIEALQKDPSSWSSRKPTDGSPGSPSSSESSTMEWGEQEEIEIVQSEPKRRKKPAPSIPYTEEETADLQRILRESETLKEAAEKMEKTHPRRTAVSIGMYCYRHKETFASDFKPRPPSIPWTKQEEQDLLRTFATSTETLLMQCQAVHDMHPHRTPLSVSAYWFKHRDRLSPLVDAIKQTLPPPPPPPPPPGPTTSSDAPPSFASILGSINSLLQNNPQASSSASSSSKRPSEEPSAPTPPKRGRLDASPPPEVILASSMSTSGSMLGLLALPRLAPPKLPPTKPQPKPRKSNPTTTKIKVEEQEVVASPVAVASKPTQPGRIILRLPPSSSASNLSTAASKTSPSKKLKLELPSPLPPPPPPASVVAPTTIPKFSLPRLSLSVPKLAAPVAQPPAAQPPTADKSLLPVSQEEVPAPEVEEEVEGGKGTRRSTRRR